jgi:hypothetical protein
VAPSEVSLVTSATAHDSALQGVRPAVAWTDEVLLVRCQATAQPECVHTLAGRPVAWLVEHAAHRPTTPQSAVSSNVSRRVTASTRHLAPDSGLQNSRCVRRAPYTAARLRVPRIRRQRRQTMMRSGRPWPPRCIIALRGTGKHGS